MKSILTILTLPLLSTMAVAGTVEVVKAVADCDANVCDFAVTLRHDDSGWDHYADRWEILSPNGDLLATRTLQHPHVDEQPFRRMLRNVTIPPGIHELRVRAHDSKHGYGNSELVMGLRADEK